MPLSTVRGWETKCLRPSCRRHRRSISTSSPAQIQTGPRELHHVLIPEKGLAFITTNARNPYDGKPYRRLRLDAMAEEKLMRAQKAKLRFTRRVEASLLDEAVSALSNAKKAHDALESAYHPCVDFEGGTALAEKEIKRLLKQ